MPRNRIALSASGPVPSRRTAVCVATLLLVGAPAAALACPVCFGAAEGPVVDAINWAVLALLGVTASVLAGIATFVACLVRRGAAAARAELQAVPTARQSGPADAGACLDGAMKGA